MRRVMIGLIGVARMRPLAILSLLLSLSVELAAGWLLVARQGGYYTEMRGSAVVSALGGLGLVLLLLMLSNLPLRYAPQVPQTHDDAPEPPTLLVRIAQLPVKWRIVGHVAWSALFVLALARLVTAISGDLHHSDALGWVVVMLNVGGIFLVVVVRMSIPA